MVKDPFAFLNDVDFQRALIELEEATRLAEGKKRVDPLLRRLELSLRKAFREQGSKFLRKFRSELRRKFAEGFAGHAAFLMMPLKEALTQADWLVIWYEICQATLKLFAEPIDQAVQKALIAGAIASIGDIGMNLSFSLENPRAVAYLQDYGAKLVTGINEETRSQLQNLLTQAADNGWSYDKTVEAISAKYEQFAVGEPQAHIDSRAHMIAVTEVGNAYCEGNLEVAQDMQAAGLEMEKYWSTVGDDKVSQTICAPNEAQGWIPLEGTFQSGHLRPLGHPACRCDLLTRRKGD